MNSGTAVTIDEFEARVIASRLIAADEYRVAIAAFPAELKADTESLIRTLVAAGHLTRHQVNEILAGHENTLVLGNYVILDRIGAGGMGTVFKASHRRMKRVAALKIVSPKLLADEQTLKRFQREVEAAARLEHPNIVTAYDADQAGETHFLVMQYVDGENLSKLVKGNGPFGWRDAVEIVLQVARGLEYAHAQGIIHRDIKPGNLLLDRRGCVKILDLGLARFRAVEPLPNDETGTAELTESGAALGTIDYMSPEQALDSKSADERSDLYSLGATFFFLLTGHSLFSGDTAMKRLLAHREKPAPSLHKYCPDAPLELDAIFQKLVAKDPGQRIPSAGALVQRLEEVTALVAASSSKTLHDSIRQGSSRANRPASRDKGVPSNAAEAETVIAASQSSLSDTIRHKIAQPLTARKSSRALPYIVAGTAAFVAGGAIIWNEWSRRTPVEELSDAPPALTLGNSVPATGIGDIALLTQKPSREYDLHPLIQSKSLAEGRFSDILILNDGFAIDATDKSRRIWVNFPTIAGEELIFETEMRIVPTNENGFVKFVFMGRPETYVMLAGVRTGRWIEIATVDGGAPRTLRETVIDEHISEGFTKFRMIVSADQFHLTIDGKTVLEVPRPSRTRGQLAITTQNWKCEFRNARAAVVP